MSKQSKPREPASSRSQDDLPKRSQSGQHRFDLSRTLSSDRAAQAIAKGKKTFGTHSSRIPSPTPSDRPPEGHPSYADLEEAGEDAKKGMNTFTHYADTITDSLFLLIGKFDASLTRINLGVLLAGLALGCMVVMIVRFEGMLSLQAEDRAKDVVLRRELKTLKEELLALQIDAKQTKKDVAEVRKQTDEQADIDIEVDEQTGRAKVVIKSREEKPDAVAPKKIEKVSKTSTKGSMQARKVRPKAKAKPAAKAQTIEIPLDLPRGAKVFGPVRRVPTAPAAE